MILRPTFPRLAFPPPPPRISGKFNTPSVRNPKSFRSGRERGLGRVSCLFSKSSTYIRKRLPFHTLNL